VIRAIIRIATEFDLVKVNVTKAGEERIRRLSAVGKYGACLGCEHAFTEQEIKDGKKKCGQCETCYNGSLYAFKKRRTTRKKLCDDGFMLAPAPGGRRPANDFTRSLSEAG
jgi:hypothetical protein